MVAIALLALLCLYPLAVHAQTCPVQIDSVTRQPLMSEMGNYGTALRLSFRNTSQFPIRGIEFGIQAVGVDKAKPEAIISYHVLAPNEGDVLLWNSTRFDRKNGSNRDFMVFPAQIQLGDGSRLMVDTSQCKWRSDGAVPPASASAVNKTEANQQADMEQLQGLIDKGLASLVTVTSEPSGANVDVDYTLLGKTPLTFVLMKTQNGSPRNIMLYKNGYTFRERDVKPTGQPVTIHEKLLPLSISR